MSADVSARSVSHTERVDKVRALQRVLYRSAKSDRNRRFHALYDKLARSDVMWRAWFDVRSNSGAPGVDGVTLAEIEESGVGAFLEVLAVELRDHRYRPQPLRRVHIPKPGKPGESRPLGIPTVRDRVVMAAAKIVLEPVFEADFSPVSFGFRPKRSAHDALEVIRVEVNNGRRWVLDADIKACFDEIDHDALLAQVARRVSDRNMLKLLRSWLRAGVFEGGVVSDAETGTPQGSPISPLLANIALHVLDEVWATQGRQHGVLVRYADDFVVICRMRSQAEQARDLAAATLAGLGLRLHPDKTRIVRLTNGKEGFDFLGFHHRLRKARKGTGYWFLNKWPGARAMTSIRDKIRARTSRRHVGWPLEWVIADLNPVLRGWGAYFRRGNSAAQFAAIDSYVHQRLARLTSAKHGRSGFGWTARYPYHWFNQLPIYRLSGTVRYQSTHALR